MADDPCCPCYSGLYLYKHSVMRILSDPAREPVLADAITVTRDALRGRLLTQAAVLSDDSIWLKFADGTMVDA